MPDFLADRRTLETLDFASIRDRVISLTQTERGRSRAQELAPNLELDRVRRAQRETAEIRELVVGSDFFVGRAVETEPMVAAGVRGQTLSSMELRAVGDSLAAAAAAYNKTKALRGAQDALRQAQDDRVIETITSAYRPLKELISALTDAINERGVVLDRASPALGRIRRNLATSQNEARERVSAMLRSSKYANAIQDAVVTIRDGRFVVPVKVEFSGEFPGIVHDTSSSGQTLFVEPLAALETNNRLRTLRLEEEREVARILAELSRRMGDEGDQIEANIEMLARLDVLVAKARLSILMQAVEPEIAAESIIEIHDGRHPLLGERAIPQSVTLGGQARLVVISGPNMGGKTVALKMVGLFVAMTYCGLQLPAGSGTRIGCFERIFTDIGDEQSIVENASTFSAHLNRMREIITQADERSLVLVDEIGGGTEPTAGAALAIAMLERLLQVRACGIVTTHATELKLFAHGTTGVLNASVRFDPATFAPTYHLDIGTPGQSLAFPLATAMGIPRELINRAQALLDNRERDYEQALSDLSTIQAQLASDRETVLKEQAHISSLQENLRKRTEALEAERRTFAKTADERMRKALADFSAELQRRAQNNAARPKVTVAQSELLSRVVDEMHRDLGIRPERAEELSEGRFEPGDRVRVLSYGQEGEVIAENGGNVLVSIGSMRTSVPKGDLRRAGAAKKAKPRGGESGEAKLGAATTSMMELDVRGKRFIEAQPVVDRWIDEAVLAGNSPLRLIHGKGTGLLGRGLQEFLKDHPSVKNVRFGDENEGGSGVTVFELR